MASNLLLICGAAVAALVAAIILIAAIVSIGLLVTGTVSI